MTINIITSFLLELIIIKSQLRIPAVAEGSCTRKREKKNANEAGKIEKPNMQEQGKQRVDDQHGRQY